MSTRITQDIGFDFKKPTRLRSVALCLVGPFSLSLDFLRCLKLKTHDLFAMVLKEVTTSVAFLFTSPLTRKSCEKEKISFNDSLQPAQPSADRPKFFEITHFMPIPSFFDGKRLT